MSHPLYDLASSILFGACCVGGLVLVALLLTLTFHRPRVGAAIMAVPVIWAIVYVVTHHP